MSNPHPPQGMLMCLGTMAVEVVGRDPRERSEEG